MPVRKIPKNYRSITGYFPSLINNRSIAYESSLERDFFLLLEYDKDVLSYEEQPLVIPYHQGGIDRTYTPDCLIFYKEHLNKKPLIAEIKYTSELEEKKVELDEKFHLIEQHAAENDMTFRVLTEKDIRGPYLDNLKFLNKFLRIPPDFDRYKQVIVRHLQVRKNLTVLELIDRLSFVGIEKAMALPTFWYMVRIGAIKTNLTIPLSNSSVLEVENGEDIS